MSRPSWMTKISFNRRAGAAFAHDLVMATLSFPLAVVLRLGPELALTHLRSPDVQLAVGLFTVVCAGVFWFFGLYRGIWRYASLQDVIAILRAVTTALVVFALVAFAVTRLEGIPRSVLFINWLLLFFMLGGPRIAYRLLRDRGVVHLFERETRFRIPVVLVGAGDGADLFIRDTTSDPSSPYWVVGIVDEKGTRVGRFIRGVLVMGSLSDLDQIVASLGRRGKTPQRLIVTRPLGRETMAALLEKADEYGMTLARLPRLTEFKNGVGTPGDVAIEPRPVALEDLLRRPQASLDRDAMAGLIAGRIVLVTGAGGSIGSEIARQAAEFNPRGLILLDNSEYLLYKIDQDVAEMAPGVARRAVLADVRDDSAIRTVFEESRPDLVLHAAALKHVPIAEAHPSEAVLTNCLGTKIVADLAAAYEVEAMVQVSTDKAINPSSIMGATKRVAESYCQAYDVAKRGRGQEARRRTRFVTVRFGNVLGSTGSVVPLFRKQIERGGPITVTHPDMTRYFMTVREAVQLILQASALGVTDGGGDEVGRIYVLDMGEPIKIVDLATQIIRLAGLKPDKDIEIVYTGPRPGEKLQEELFHQAEPMLVTRHPSLRLASARTGSLEMVGRGIEELVTAARNRDDRRIRALLHNQLPEYGEPSGTLAGG